MVNEFLPLLGNGEEYIFSESSRPGPPIIDKSPAYEVVRANLLNDIHTVKEKIKNIPDHYRTDEVIVNLKMSVGFTAKSFHPNDLIKQSGATDVGSKKWTKTEFKNNKKQVKSGKNIFLRMSDEELSYFESILNKKESSQLRGFILDVRRIDELFFDDNSKILNIFSPEWQEGRIELVLHPFGDQEQDVIQKFLLLFKDLGGNLNKVKWKSYFPGPIFVSMYTKRNILVHHVVN